MPTLDDNLHELGKSKVFSKADLSSGYWHVQLDEESSLLTTFQTTTAYPLVPASPLRSSSENYWKHFKAFPALYA